MKDPEVSTLPSPPRQGLLRRDMQFLRPLLLFSRSLTHTQPETVAHRARKRLWHDRKLREQKTLTIQIPLTRNSSLSISFSNKTLPAFCEHTLLRFIDRVTY